MADLTLFHTAKAHVETFDRLAPDADLTHVVRPDWLERAQGGIDAALRQDITQAIQAVQGPVLCSCTTIGDVAEKAGATRIDWPMMQKAAEIGGPVMLAYCLDSTRAPSTTLLERAFRERGKSAEIRALPLTGLWHHFTDGNNDAFHRQIATWVNTSLTLVADTSCVVLAQASMAGAARFIDTDVPILASPEIAIRALLKDV
ncbi:hypothetical protein PXK01_09430 [Phaeobacter sp. PT47_59]|uniref:hypothetical protein n=1 Tax=Phaeobacter sp. PT47_59 TaxID=3029979 RepID=UPI0023801E93|nr:hypothetical protein [Phaeobacter sp. PT47_59]MDE4174377.1 hypothetical protein [Phaeobacter sp. PT47_59]